MPFKKGDPRAKEYGRKGGLTLWRNHREKALMYARKGLAKMRGKGAIIKNKKAWRENREKMLQIARKGMIRSLQSAKLHNHQNSYGELMRSKEEVLLSEQLHKMNIKYEYEKQLGYAIPDFVIGKIIIEVAGLPYDKYWLRMEKKYRKYLDDGFIPIIWNTSGREISIVPNVSSLEEVVSLLKLYIGQAW